MNHADREKTLRNFSSELNRLTPERAPKPDGTDFSAAEVAFLAEGLAFSQRALRAATGKVTERYNLGPRGAWILNVVSNGIKYPLQLATIFRVGRSLITAELVRLTEAGLIETRPGADDRRKTELTLTPLGVKASAEVRAEFSVIVHRRLAGFEPADLRIAAEVLRALAREPEAPE